MALSNAEKAQAIRLLGYPAKTLTAGTTSYSKILSDRLTGLSDDAEAEARQLLVRVAAIDGKLESALDRLTALKVDSIETNPREIEMLKGERSRLIRELGATLDIPVQAKSGLNMNVIV